MYRYDSIDREFLADRSAEFRGQVERRLAGELTEDEFKPLRLKNGLYLQLHAYMLRIAVPYGTLATRQMRMLAHIARKYDRGFGHFTTRQNMQFHWPKLVDVPDILSELASVEMHCIQTSGNCVRNITADHFAGAVAGEVEDPRVLCEIMRQWSTFHPEFNYLPRKFKIAVTASTEDRAAIKFHDIGIEVVRSQDGQVGYRVYVGGGMGRTPYVGLLIGEWVSKEDILAYLEAVLRVYNEYGRRDNLWKARVKILAHTLGAEEMRRQVEVEFKEIKEGGALRLPPEEMARIEKYFAPPKFEVLAEASPEFDSEIVRNRDFAHWAKTNLTPHRARGYAIATGSLKPLGRTPGDISAEQMDGLAQIMDDFGYDEIRVTHEQNMVLPHVRRKDLPELFARLASLELATPNAGLISDIICCPGLDYCDLANARSI